METPETIKNALRLCATPDSCGVCPYIRGGRCPQKNSDALAYIEQLEARLAGAAEPAAPRMFFDSMDELAEVQKDWQRRLDLTKFSDKRTPDCSQECPLRSSRDYHFRKETPVTCRECLNQFLSLVLWELGCNAGEICKAEDARWQGK